MVRWVAYVWVCWWYMEILPRRKNNIFSNHITKMTVPQLIGPIMYSLCSLMLYFLDNIGQTYKWRNSIKSSLCPCLSESVHCLWFKVSLIWYKFRQLSIIYLYLLYLCSCLGLDLSMSYVYVLSSHLFFLLVFQNTSYYFWMMKNEFE